MWWKVEQHERKNSRTEWIGLALVVAAGVGLVALQVTGGADPRGLRAGAADGVEWIEGADLVDAGTQTAEEAMEKARYVCTMQEAQLGRLLADSRWLREEQRPHLEVAVEQTRGVVEKCRGETAEP